MNWILLISMAFHLTALVWSVEFLRRSRDGRLAFLLLMLALMVLHRGLALSRPGVVSMSRQWDELPGLAISVMSLLAVFFLGTLLDELKQSHQSGERANKELDERERRLQAISESELDCVKLLGPNYTLLQMNPAGLRMVEADSFDQVVGRSVLDLVLPEYQPAFAELTERVLRGSTERLEFEIQGLRGSRRWLETYATPERDASGKIVSLLGVTRDITERKRVDAALRSAEALFRNLVEHSLVGIQIVQDGRYAFANSKLAEIFGYTEAEVLALDSWTCVVADEDRDMVLDQVRRRVSGETPRAHYVFRGIRKDRTVIDIEIRSDRIELHGRPAVLGMLIDITERRRAEAELRASRERLQVLSRQLLNAQEAERRNIARELHDQIGQSLTAIKLNLKALQPAEEETSKLTILHETVAVVDQTLEQVRTLSLDLRPSMLDDLGLVAALRWYLNRQAGRAGFSVQFVAESADGDVSKEIETTCFRVTQEIVTNIARHARAPNVRVELRRLDTELELFIQDDGVGFDPTAARERAMRGTSLGLLGMQERVLIVDGRMDIQSEPSRGTEVRVRFPLMPTAPGLERDKREE